MNIEELTDFGATKAEIVDAIHAGANQADIARLEGAVWRLFDRVSGLKYFISARNDLLEQNQKLLVTLRQIATCEIEFSEGVPAGYGHPVMTAEEMSKLALAAIAAATGETK